MGMSCICCGWNVVVLVFALVVVRASKLVGFACDDPVSACVAEFVCLYSCCVGIVLVTPVRLPS